MEKMHKLVTNPVVGKVVTGWLAGNIPITEVTDDHIIYGDVVTDEMEQAHRKVVGLALNGPAN